LNLAAIWKLPIIFVCENNRYAESTPVEYALAGGSVAGRAAGYAMPGVAVDGQSVLDMYEVGGEAVKRARTGGGPTLIEAETYRYLGHFGADNTLLYRTEEEEAYYRGRDCIKRLGGYMVETGVATEDDLEKMDQQAVEDVAAASRFANESPYPGPEELYDDVYIRYPREALIAGTQFEGLPDPDLIEPAPAVPTAPTVGKSG
jgi:pyruvate dehydrogenase E1 component alpha subunit